MNLSDMITLVRKDLHDTESGSYRWTDTELTRHINRAVAELSESLPQPVRTTLPTTAQSRELDISSLSDRIMVAAVEYPLGTLPPSYQQFFIWGDTLTIMGGDEPDGGNCNIYYGSLHTLDAQGSTLPSKYVDLVAGGAAGYAAIEWASYATNRVNVGGTPTAREYLDWGNQRLKDFRQELRRLGRRNVIRVSSLYSPYTPFISSQTDYGP
jgi:hypothetical protein